MYTDSMAGALKFFVLLIRYGLQNRVGGTLIVILVCIVVSFQVFN